MSELPTHSQSVDGELQRKPAEVKLKRRPCPLVDLLHFHQQQVAGLPVFTHTVRRIRYAVAPIACIACCTEKHSGASMQFDEANSRIRTEPFHSFAKLTIEKRKVSSGTA